MNDSRPPASNPAGPRGTWAWLLASAGLDPNVGDAAAAETVGSPIPPPAATQASPPAPSPSWWSRSWRALNRPRGARPRSRRSRPGIALLLVITVISLLTVVVTEVVHGAAIRIQMAANQRDEAKAEALAMSGIQFYRLLLIASQQLGKGFYNLLQSIPGLQFAPITSDTLWQLVPDLSSNMMRMLLLTDNDVDDAMDIKKKGGLTQDQRDESQEVVTRLHKPFLDFDGDFTAHVEDEDKRIFIGRLRGQNMAQLQSDPQAGMLASLMSGDRQDNFLNEIDLDKWELIAALVDWTDPDDQRLFDGGSEQSAYENLSDLEDPYPPKNAQFDTQEELRLVEGWNRDQVWLRYGRHLTIYGSGKVNINTADRRVMEAIFQRFIQPPPTQDSMQIIWQQIDAFRNTPVYAEGGGGIFHDVGNFVALLREIAPGTLDDSIQQQLTTSSTVFRVSSEGEVGDSKVVISAVFDFSRSPIGKVLYWQVQ